MMLTQPCGGDSVLGSPQLLCDEPSLRGLLVHYRDSRGDAPETAWQDRIGDLPNVEAQKLSKMYGLLLAYGWLDVKLGHDVLAIPGSVSRAYQITREGLRMLRQTEGPFGAIRFVPSEEEEEPADSATDDRVRWVERSDDPPPV
jgi:hypothetical protein